MSSKSVRGDPLFSSIKNKQSSSRKIPFKLHWSFWAVTANLKVVHRDMECLYLENKSYQ